MEPNPISVSESTSEDLPAVLGELIVENGRLRGTRRALTSALTLIGRDPACEVHLNIEGVNPLHCALLHGPEGFLLRDLNSVSGTFLNGESIRNSLVRHGDLLAVGPFQFRLDLPSSAESTEPPLTAEALRMERDALRIQAAAVAAQQASLSEEELQLQQRRKALARQKGQLAAHLDERRQQLLDLREQARLDRATLKTETEAARRQTEEVRAALEKERQAVRLELQQAAKERRRSIEFRKRLKRRWRKQWQAHEAALQQSEGALAGERDKLDCVAADLRRERVRLTQNQLRFNGEVEVGRLKLQDEWQQLGLAQQQWEACLNQERTEQTIRLRAIDRREAGLAANEHSLNEQTRNAEQLHLKLRKEAEGLDARIRNQRRKLVEQEKLRLQPSLDPVLSPASIETISLAPMVVRASEPEVPRVLARLAGELADQRLHLLEQWESFLKLYEVWEPERAAILAEIEATAQHLVQRERWFDARGQALSAGEDELRRRQEALFEIRCSLEAWQARLTARETFLDNERVMLLADVRAREEQAEAQGQRLEEMRQRRARRRGQEIEELRAAREQHEQMRRDYALLWQECQDRRAQLIREQRDLAARAVALEQFRQELMRRAADTPEADKRLERLRRRSLARIRAEERDLTRERAALRAETKRLDDRAGRLLDKEESLTVQHETWMRQLAEGEDQQTAAADLDLHRRHELRHWQLLHEQDERQLKELREEVERIARLLLDEGETNAPPLAA